jgi:hypothetical protein
MRRFVLGILLAILLSSLIILAVYPLNSAGKISTFPASITLNENGSYSSYSNLQLHFPAWAVVNITCGNGEGDLYVYNAFTQEVVFETNFSGSIRATFSIPKEGTYIVGFRSNGSATCSLVATRFHAPEKVQARLSFLGISSSLLLSLLLWRWKG